MTLAAAPRRWQAVVFVCAGVFLGAIDFYIVSVAIPDMLRSFPHAGIAGISWVVNGYTVTFTAALLPAGGLADRYGHRRIFLVGLAIFSLSALGCAAAPSAGVLVAARLVQGAGGGTITPLALALIVPRFPAERRGTAIGLWTATQSAAVAAGPSVGGILVSAVGWRAVFLLQLPIGLVALGGTAWALRGGTPAVAAAGPAPDLVGVVLLVGAIGLPSLAIVQSNSWGVLSWRTDAAMAAGLALGAAFVRRSLRHRAPVIDLALLAVRQVRRANIAMILVGLVMFAVPFGGVLFLIGVWRYSEARAGLAVTPGPILQALAALAGGRLCNRFGARAVVVSGAFLLVASTLLFALGTGSTPRYWAVVFPALAASSVAVGFLLTSLSSFVVSGVPADKLASGTSLLVAARAVGAVASLSAFALLLAAQPGGTRALAAYHVAWAAMSAIAVVLVVVTSVLLRRGDQAAEGIPAGDPRRPVPGR
ncbi:MAG TPA: MFS transporter [Streptosporangiaceae bacterium]|nr:MFS transporter [Streptosporangiaceae bacterium]